VRKALGEHAINTAPRYQGKDGKAVRVPSDNVERTLAYGTGAAKQGQ
jgi:hypothetical protein